MYTVQYFCKGCPQQILGGQKRPKFAVISDNFRLWSRIPPKQINITKIGKVRYQVQIIPIERKKFGEVWFTNKKVIGVNVQPPKWTFSGDYISALKGCSPSNFYTPYDPKIVFSVGLGVPGGLKLGSAPYFYCNLFWDTPIEHKSPSTRLHFCCD